MELKLIEKFDLRIEEYGGVEGCESVRSLNVYNAAGKYIGEVAEFKHFVEEFGITHFDVTHKDNSVCSIGLNSSTQEWFGWSHRAIAKFAVGSFVRKGDIAYKCKDKKEFAEEMVKYFDGYKSEELITKDGVKGVMIYREGDDVGGIFQAYPNKWGKGEWQALTVEDAKEMASDFADGVA